MSTLTALQPRPYVLNRTTAEVELVQAKPEDLKTYDPLLATDVLRKNLVFWLQSSITGKIEATPRLLTEDYDVQELKTWLELKMIWIAKSPFN